MVGRENVNNHEAAPQGVAARKARKEIALLLVILKVEKEKGKERVNPDPLLLNQAVPVKARVRVLARNGRTLAAVRAVRTVNTAMLGRVTRQILFVR